ncbi:glycoside hydrolase family 88 protein [Paenibacillus radicis (ex Xue et al. 2023)]|uniref:Glycoside hydrolase family 88 protein n=1 Tax=Paenibacillus radicis (ex Xue et al. 2023) TaxID=2972489 RepID=A0ABT1Y9I7_9BACL|nr:glycoside hydrolase family 88 protein [Paenibacillus radicis (ex Xue et al. 2023)]MCR8629856.1 glycoside hydrolase family 88 protein [Paenibacillus radicis (ex Xue et al. 2023)]
MWKQAIEQALQKTRENIERFGDQFPHVGENGKYLLNDNNEWTDGFWSGILWLCYEYSGDEAFKAAANKTVESFRNRLDKNTKLDHHDIGFLYSLSSKAQWIIEGDEEARQLTLQAADVLMSRWRAKGGYIQAWGPEGDPENGGRIIIDCLMNLPLLYWAYEQTGKDEYKEVAVAHADKSRRFLVRGDDSSYHTFYFDQETGEAIRGGTHQGYSDGSTWTRGQAWGIYGFALSYRYTKNPLYLETSKRLANYFLERLPEDDVVYWDFNVAINSETKRDSSASAITAAGIIELLTHLEAGDPDRELLQDGLQRSLQGLVKGYSTVGQPDAEGLLDRGSYSVRGGVSPDDYVIWGDYYYLEALVRLEKGIQGYWYERK